MTVRRNKGNCQPIDPGGTNNLTVNVTKKSAEPSGAPAEDKPDGVDLTLPKHMDLVFDWDKPSNKNEAAAMDDAANFFRAIYRGVDKRTAKDPAVTTYATGEGLHYAKTQIESRVDDGWSATGIRRHYQASTRSTANGNSADVNWAPPPCWYAPYLGAKDFKKKMSADIKDQMDTPGLGSGGAALGQLQRHYEDDYGWTDNPGYKDYNVEKGGEGCSGPVSRTPTSRTLSSECHVPTSPSGSTTASPHLPSTKRPSPRRCSPPSPTSTWSSRAPRSPSPPRPSPR